MPATAEAWLRSAMARKENIMGFGHRVYKAGDVRAGILKEYARRAAEQANALAWEESALEFVHDCSTESMTRGLCGCKELGANEFITQGIRRHWLTLLTGIV